MESNFLTEVVSELTREGVPRDLLFVNWEGLLGDMLVGDCLRHSDHKAIEFSVLGEARRAVSKSLDFQRTDFDFFRDLKDKVLCETLLKGKGDQEGWIFFKNKIMKVQEQANPVCQKMSCKGRRPALLNRELLQELWKKRSLGHGVLYSQKREKLP